MLVFFFFSSRRRHTRWPRDWSSDVCSSDLTTKRRRFVVRRAPTAQRLAPVVDKVDPIGAGRIFSFENTDVAAADRIRRVLVIPIGNQHDQDFQAVELRSAIERVPRPGPGAIVEETRSGLEARERRIRKRAVVLDKSRRALECRDSGDAP